MILVGLCIREADRLGKPAVEFIARNGSMIFAVGKAYQEYESLLDGYESGQVGVYEELVSNLVKVSFVLDKNPDANMKEILSEVGLTGNACNRVATWIGSMSIKQVEDGGYGNVLRAILRRWEATIAQRRSDLRKTVPRWDPDIRDIPEIDRIENEIARKWPGGGSWKNDGLIFAQTHGRACSEDVTFVSDDRDHFGNRRESLLRMTRVQEIEGLDGNPLRP